MGALVIYSDQTPTRSSLLRFGLRTSPWKFNAPRIATAATVSASQARTNVLFPANSSKLTEAGKAKLLSLVTRTGKAGVVSVVGFARGPQLRPQMTALSDARARNVSSFLRSLGVTGAHTIRGVWVVGGRPSTGRQVSISISCVP
jgi:outer membrane protein OmpA-like peptidoglycan-associated protein